MGKRIFVIVGLTFSVGLLDGLGLTMFLPLFQIAAEKQPAPQPDSAAEDVVGKLFQSTGFPVSLVNILFVMACFFIIKGIFNFFKLKFDADSARYFMLRTRKRLFSAFSNVSYNYYVKADVGRIQNIMTGELNTVYVAFTQYVGMIQQSIMLVVYMGFAVLMNAQFAILITVGGLIFNFFFSKIYKVTKDSSRKRVSAANSYQGLIIQFVTNFKYLKATGLLGEFGRKVDQNIEDIERENRKMGYMNAIAGALREPILIIIVAGVILFQVYVLGGALSTVIISLMFFYRALTAVTFLQQNFNTFNTMIGTLENVEWFEAELSSHHEKQTGDKHLQSLKGGLELKNVEFAFERESVLREINLTIPENTTVALVGESGSGKTTMINILTGLLPVTRGEYLIGGQPVQDLILKDLQSKIGYISQEAVIFNDTIFNNVTFWAEPTVENATRFFEALKKAEIYDFVSSLTEKEDTLLGNNGVNLSGGQKQRISIARELFKEAKILILDEATSALDSETEKAIQSNIDALKGTVTIVIIAHRLSTVKNADEIILLDAGRIINRASFDELRETDPKFRRMVELQEM